ncbi:hypothetical protein H310_14300 [Aphanomyces invadans]|uniref:Uncharacterized protein n=1 Tax=Aphanomyces invadans TaxID=157072 RepID=A0A024TA86_9STRA|nr:hypothetical protein H310_14300 [Aphanomyces invadans]ETV91065.1 hypothetical protein H310_14300 [Aphanomyces invadans]|eukprot:XP_008880345.1 hypothetical protein H310_14300 [Aphanomyces invadans]
MNIIKDKLASRINLKRQGRLHYLLGDAYDKICSSA